MVEKDYEISDDDDAVKEVKIGFQKLNRVLYYIKVKKILILKLLLLFVTLVHVIV